MFLSYTVTAVFLGLTLLGLVLLGGLSEMLKRQPEATTLGFAALASAGDPTLRRSYLKTVAVLLGATILATLLFYGQYIIVLITETLPTMANAASSGSLKPTAISWPDYFVLVGQTMVSYSLWPIYLLGLVGIAGYIVRERSSAATFSKALLLSLVLVGILFIFVNYYVDMAVKEFWWALPALALGGGWLLDRVDLPDGSEGSLAKGAMGMARRALPMLICASFVINSLWLWFDRLFFHNR